MVVLKKFLRIIFTLAGTIGGVALSEALIGLLSSQQATLEFSVSEYVWVVYLVSILVGTAIGFFISPLIIKLFNGMTKALDRLQKKFQFSDLIICLFGLIIGLIIAFLLSGLISNIPGDYIAFLINLFSYGIFIYMGIHIFYKRREDIPLPKWIKRKSATASGDVMVIDTSALIDGRIYDVCRSGFLSGTVIVPMFVLDELRHIADSPDTIKRTKGRRGLEILDKLKDESGMKIVTSNIDYEELPEVDSKLLRLASDNEASIITTDYNLNKVAAVQNVKILNINELANAIKVILVPGEELTVNIVKEGKEDGQGLAYLEDGTMIVVENGLEYVGKKVKVTVTTMLQTAAGRMVFARIME